MGIVSTEVAWALRGMGYPQDKWPQSVWWREIRRGDGTDDGWTVEHFDGDDLGPHTLTPEDTAYRYRYEWVAAPDHLTALCWLEDQGWEWETHLIYDEHGEPSGGRTWTAQAVSGVGMAHIEDWSIDGLILKIAQAEGAKAMERRSAPEGVA